jgi:hypothetical protein
VCRVSNSIPPTTNEFTATVFKSYAHSTNYKATVPIPREKMSIDESTLLASKTRFLNSQVRILSQPLKASTKAKEEIEISESVVSDVMRKGMVSFFAKSFDIFDAIATYPLREVPKLPYYELGTITTIASLLSFLSWN